MVLGVEKFWKQCGDRADDKLLANIKNSLGVSTLNFFLTAAPVENEGKRQGPQVCPSEAMTQRTTQIRKRRLKDARGMKKKS